MPYWFSFSSTTSWKNRLDILSPHFHYIYSWTLSFLSSSSTWAYFSERNLTHIFLARALATTVDSPPDCTLMCDWHLKLSKSKAKHYLRFQICSASLTAYSSLWHYYHPLAIIKIVNIMLTPNWGTYYKRVTMLVSINKLLHLILTK